MDMILCPWRATHHSVLFGVGRLNENRDWEHLFQGKDDKNLD